MTERKTWKRSRTALSKADNYDKQIAQVYGALKLIKEHHERMLEAGFTWDGVDTYTAPESMTTDDFNRIVRQAP